MATKKPTPKTKADRLIKVKPRVHKIFKIEAAERDQSIGDLMESVADGFKK